MTLRRIRPLEIVLLLLTTALMTAAVRIVASRLRPAPSLAGLDRLLGEQKFDEAEARLLDHLVIQPESSQAHMLMAQVALARADQKPELALLHLRKVHIRDKAHSAIVRLNEGKAYSALGRYPLAERAWREALRIDPAVPEAGWALLGLYYVQGRREDAHRLAMRLFDSEPDPRDRAQLLLELLRQDALGLVVETLVPTLEPIVLEHPDDYHTAIALALAYVRTSRPEDGLSILRQLAERFPESADVRDALCCGLDEASRHDELSETVKNLPVGMATDARFDKYKGAVAQSLREWDRAVELYERSWNADPSEFRVLYRLCQVLRLAGRVQEQVSLEPLRRANDKAREEALALYRKANAVSTLGTEPHPELYQNLAALRGSMGRLDEALAWHKLVLRDDPQNAISRTAIESLSARMLGFPRQGAAGPS
jgi:tetratricopeptide (TPR) repeat protein